MEPITEGVVWEPSSGSNSRSAPGEQTWMKPSGTRLPDGNYFVASMIYDYPHGYTTSIEVKILDPDLQPITTMTLKQYPDFAMRSHYAVKLEDHTVLFVVADFTTLENRYSADAAYTHIYLLDCRDGKVSVLSETMDDSEDMADLYLGRYTSHVYIREKNLVVIAEGSEMIFTVKNGAVADVITLDRAFYNYEYPFMLPHWGLSSDPSNPLNIGFYAYYGREHTPRSESGVTAWQMELNEDGTIKEWPAEMSSSTISTFDFSEFLYASSPYAKHPFVIGNDYWSDATGPYHIKVWDVSGPVGELIESVAVHPEQGYYMEPGAGTLTGSAGYDGVFVAHEFYVWGPEFTYTWNGTTRTTTYDPQYILFMHVSRDDAGEVSADFVTTPIGELTPDGFPDWQFFSRASSNGNFLTSYYDGEVFCPLIWLENDWPAAWIDPSIDAADYTLAHPDATMVKAWTLSVDDGTPFRLQTGTGYQKIGDGTKPRTPGVLNLRLDGRWLHEWTTEDDVTDHTALRYPLKIKLPDGNWQVVAVFTDGEPSA